MSGAKPWRLQRPEQFRACYKKGRVYKNHIAVIHVLPNELDVTRVGYSVSKRLGNAVIRNRVRRRLRAIVETRGLVPGYDVVVAARVRAVASPFVEIEDSVCRLLQRSGLLHPSPK